MASKRVWRQGGVHQDGPLDGIVAARKLVTFTLKSLTRVTILGFGLAVLAGAGFPGGAVAQDMNMGRQKATAVCALCHGKDGIAKIAEAPNLAGQNQMYLVEQLTAFKSGQRKSEIMSVIAGDLSDADIQNLAVYYSSIPISVGKIPEQ
jgi:cytochrome c553